MKDKELELLANTARQEIIKMLLEAKSGHTAGPLGLAEIFITLYYDHAKVDPQQPASVSRDYIYVSNGHVCPIWYVTLAMKGFFPIDHLASFRKINALLQGHPHNETIPGVENSGGPLAQGISQAAGCALALKIDNKPNQVYCFCGDGEQDEGQVWEALMFAANRGLDNLTVIVDRNDIQIDGPTHEIMNLEPLADKYRAFGWYVLEINGHDICEIRRALKRSVAMRGKPTIIIAKTVPGKGVKEFENNYHWHGTPPNAEQAKRALEELLATREKIQNRWFS
jgi:transketolase